MFLHCTRDIFIRGQMRAVLHEKMLKEGCSKREDECTKNAKML
jgi:hypothetical protein